MGQYFKAFILDEDAKITHMISCFDFDHSSKLMDAAWLGNAYVEAVEGLLAQEAPVRVVWGGDYADAELDENGEPLEIESDYYSAGRGPGNLYILHKENVDKIIWYRPEVRDFGMSTRATRARRKDGSIIFRRARDRSVHPNAWPKIQVTTESHPYLINWDKKLYVDKRLIERETVKWAAKEDWRIHPLPLLTVEGNGRGGGDFSGEDPNHLVGSWARDHLSVSDHVAHEGFEELKFDLHL